MKLPAFQFRLTPQEKNICRRIMRRSRTKIIASDLGISEKTVRVHLSNIYRRFALDGKPDLILFLAGDPKRLA